MNSNDLATFNQAVQLAQTGQKDSAYLRLKSLLKTNNNHHEPGLLLWLAFTSPDLQESEMALARVTNLDPNNPGLNSARAWLAQERLARQNLSVGTFPSKLPPLTINLAAPFSPAQPNPQNQTQPQPPLTAPKATLFSSQLTGLFSRRVGFGRINLPLWAYLVSGLVSFVLILGLAKGLSGETAKNSSVAASPASLSSRFNIASGGLGLSKVDWEKKYGKPDSGWQYNPAKFLPKNGVPYANARYQLNFTYSYAEKSNLELLDNNDKVQAINLQFANSTPIEQGKAAALKLMPEDSKFVRAYRTKDSETLIETYSSEALKTVFQPATGAKYKYGGQAGSPGLFAILYAEDPANMDKAKKVLAVSLSTEFDNEN